MESQKDRRVYYSQRTGKRNIAVDFDALKKIFVNLYEEFDQKQYFDEHFGKQCVDNGLIPGKAGNNIDAYVLRKLRKNLWPIRENSDMYSEEDLFDVIEFLFDHISFPIEKNADYHSFGNCGYHFKDFDAEVARKDYAVQINELLNDYGDGYELGLNGEIYSLLQEEFRPLLNASIPTNDPDNVENKIRKSIDKFRRYGSTLDERKEAVRALADCLEYLRIKMTSVITEKDDNDLFNIANNFGIRHHNDKQKTKYDQAIWLSWMFYFYLATLHASLRLIEKQKLL